MNAFDKIDYSMPLTVLGYYYDKDDTNKSHAHFKDECIIILNDGLSLFITTILQKSILEPEIQDRLQTLSKCTKTERDLVTSWHDIKPVITLFSEFNAITGINELIEKLNVWNELGVQEIVFDWYKKLDNMPESKRFTLMEEFYLSEDSKAFHEGLKKLREDFPPFKVGSGSNIKDN